jgi:hypothetical protein
LAEFKDAQVTTVDENKTGEVAAGFLPIKAPIASARCEIDHVTVTLQLASLTRHERLGRDREVWLPISDCKDHLRIDDYQQIPPLEVTLLALYRAFEGDERSQAHAKPNPDEKTEELRGLILKQTEHAGEYQRLGVFIITNPVVYNVLRNSLQRTIIIV